MQKPGCNQGLLNIKRTSALGERFHFATGFDLLTA
jgi:hypothetical protein